MMYTASWWYSQIPLMMKVELMFPGQTVVHTSVVAVNLKHRNYTRGLRDSVLRIIRHNVWKEIPEEYRRNAKLLAWNKGRGLHVHFMPRAVCFPPLQPNQAIVPYRYFTTNQ